MSDSNDRYEKLAEDFYRKTGMYAPGKDRPVAAGGAWYEEDEQWEKWNEFISSVKQEK